MKLDFQRHYLQHLSQLSHFPKQLRMDQIWSIILAALKIQLEWNIFILGLNSNFIVYSVYRSEY